MHRRPLKVFLFLSVTVLALSIASCGEESDWTADGGQDQASLDVPVAQDSVPLLDQNTISNKIPPSTGMDKQLYVVIGSDFGRTPHYDKAGKADHWNITSFKSK